MKTKTVLRSLFLAYGLTGVCLLLLAFLAFQFDLGLAPVSAGIVAVYVISCLAGGFMAGKIMRKDKCFWGILVGLAYFILLVLVSFAAEGKWDMSFQHLLTTFVCAWAEGLLEACLHNLKKDFYLREFYAILCPDNYIYIRRIYNGAYQNIKYKKSAEHS